MKTNATPEGDLKFTVTGAPAGAPLVTPRDSRRFRRPSWPMLKWGLVALFVVLVVIFALINPPTLINFFGTLLYVNLVVLLFITLAIGALIGFFAGMRYRR